MDQNIRPAYVQFEIRSIEDRTASEEAGHFVARDEIFAIVTPAGTKDRLEKPAEAWLEGVAEGVRQERIPATWLAHYKASFEAFKDSRELPEEGTPISAWPQVSPAQVKNLLDANIRTVEDLAQATEEAVSRIGMGGRALKSKAAAWLESANSTGKVSGQLEKLRVENADLKTRNENLQEQVKTLKTELAALQSATTAKD